MKLLTYNIRLGIQEGLSSVSETLREVDADIVALQEVGRHWIMGPGRDTTLELATRAGYPHFLFVPSISLAAGPAQYGHAILSKHPWVQPRVIQLSQQVDERRTALFCPFNGPHGRFVLVTTHLSHIEDNPVQALELAHALPSSSWVLMGDLNLEFDDPILAPLRERGQFADPSFSTFPSTDPRTRIDHIVVSDGTLNEVSRVGNVGTSDHFGVSAQWSR